MWIVAWRYNERDISEKYDSYPDALSRIWRLSEQGIVASIHLR